MECNKNEILDVYKREISKNLKHLLSISRMSILEFSDDLDLSYRTVYNLVEGKLNPTLDTLTKVAKHFNIKISQILGEHPLEGNSNSCFTRSVSIVGWLEITELLDCNQIKTKKNYPSILISSDKMLSDKVFAIYSNIQTEPLFKTGTILVFDILLSNIKDYDDKFLLILGNNSSLLIKKLIIKGDDIFLQAINDNGHLELFSDKFRILAHLIQAHIALENR